MDSHIIAQFDRTLHNLDAILSKAAANAQARGFSPDAFLGSRLSPDMLAFPRQIQIACDVAKATASNLSGVAAPKFEDTETTLAELRGRIAKTRDYLATVPLAAIEACPPDRDVAIPFPPGKKLSAEAYLYQRQLGNFYFHVTTTYALLRLQGVPLGKADFLGELPYQQA